MCFPREAHRREARVGLEILRAQSLAVVGPGAFLGGGDGVANVVVQGGVEIARDVAAVHGRFGAALGDDEIESFLVGLFASLLGSVLPGSSLLVDFLVGLLVGSLAGCLFLCLLFGSHVYGA